MDEVISNLWISDMACALSAEHLIQANITHIITATSSRLALPALPADHPQISQLHIRIDDEDLAPIIVHFEKSNQFIENAIGKHQRERTGNENEIGKKNNVLVHCHAGVSRSVTLVAAYLMSVQNLSPTDALDQIKARRTQACPNDGFLQQLELYSQISHNLDVSNQLFRRFLLSYTSRSILRGNPIDEALLSYYPTPLSSPSNSMKTDGLPMLDRDEKGELRVVHSSRKGSDGADPDDDKTQDSDDKSETLSALSLGGRLPGGVQEVKGLSSKHHPLSNSTSTNVRKPNFKGQIILRCKKCGRELAAKEHVVEHEVGERGMGIKSSMRIGGKKLEKDQGRILSGPGGMRIDARSGNLNTSNGIDENEKKIGEIKEGQHDEQLQKEKEAEEEQKIEDQEPAKPKFQSAASLSSRLPPHLAALRRGVVPSGNGNLNPNRPPVSKPLPKSANPPPSNPTTTSTPTNSSESTSTTSVTASPDSTPTSTSTSTTSRPTPRISQGPLLHSSLCSSYFLEPLQWMSNLLISGEIEGKLICPGGAGGTIVESQAGSLFEKGGSETDGSASGRGKRTCGAKLGNWDWAGVQCGCGTWITPAFALARTKVDEIQT